MADNSLTTVDFHGAKLIARRGDTPAETLVAMKPVVEGMGLTWQRQHEKLSTHPVLSKGITVMVMPSRGGPQEMTALPLNRLNFWLATIQPDRVPDDATRAKVIAYQTECADLLFDHFFGRAHDVLTPAQCRDLRAMLGATRPHLAALSGVDLKDLCLFEGDRLALSRDAQAALRRALDVAAAQMRKATKPKKAIAAPPPEAVVRLQFTVPVSASAKICAYVARITGASAKRGE